jgi:hypothetical protein
MSIAIAEATYSFPNGEPESTALIAVPASILEQILSEVQDLKAIVARQDGELATLRVQIAALDSRQDLEVERLALDIASDRRRLTKLEIPPKPEPKPYSSKVDAHLSAIYGALLAREAQDKQTGFKSDYMAFWEVEELLDLSHRRVSQLAEIAANDPRFMISWHPKKQHMKVFRINPFTLGRMAAALHKELNAKT